MLIIRLDGATGDVLMPIVREKKFPTLENLVKKWKLCHFGINCSYNSHWYCLRTIADWRGS